MASHSLNFGVSTMRRKAARLFWSWLRSSRDSPRAPDGWWMTLVPVSRLFWFWPPLPPERKCWTSQSRMLIDRIRSLHTVMRFMIPAKEVPGLLSLRPGTNRFFVFTDKRFR
jgi:hypothetical protein